MKKLLVIVTLYLSACGGNGQQSQSTAWNMTWNCNTNATCAYHMGSWYGSGSFSNETDCLAWETAFLNSYGSPYDSVTACTAN